MNKKLRQVTDSIHGTIYLSSLESELISTAYFYRLHDIYQSSTVYMTYPNNRTKRYEHSLGTMELASSMLFSAVSNTDKSTRDLLFKKLRDHFIQIFDLAFLHSQEQVAPYFTSNRDKISGLFIKMDREKDSEEIINEFISKCISKAVDKDEFADSALDHYQFFPMVNFEEGETCAAMNLFLYRCLLQAVRIVALFHDVGHPPYSHIIESVLKTLYDESKDNDISKEWDPKKKKKLQGCLEPYLTKYEDSAYSCQMLYSHSSLVNADPHERIGLSLLQSALNDTMPEVIGNLMSRGMDDDFKIVMVLYNIMVAEFVIAILVEKNSFFASFHKIVDGVIDADRLDYISRDSQNSGVDWGTIPYKRIINSAKMIHVFDEDKNDGFAIAYPKKVVDDIEDLLLIRYKIFARINFHHRCMKTAAALQSAVHDLAVDFLKNDSKSCINKEISTLWMALDTSIGDRKTRIIQWNDSWLISELHKSLVQISNQTKPSYVGLRDNLEEILLNKKKYYALIKRGTDSQRLVEMSMKAANITEQRLEEIKKKEILKYFSNDDAVPEKADIMEVGDLDAMDACDRFEDVMNAQRTGDLELLQRLFPEKDATIVNVIEGSLKRLRDSGTIQDYKWILNSGRGKIGLPKHRNQWDEIYLFDGLERYTFDENRSLWQQIKAIEQNVPWLNIYFVPSRDSDSSIVEVIRSAIAKDLASALSVRFNELFPSAHISA